MIVRNDIDDQELAAAIAAARARDRDVDELEARRRSRAAIRRWSTRIPAGLSAENDVPLLIDRHREYWLRSAADFVRGLDPCGLGAGSLHAIDAGELGVESEQVIGFVFPGLFHAARSLLPRSAAPGPTVAVNVRELVRDVLAQDDELDERSVRESVRITASAVVIHEVAHAVDQELAGDTVDAVSAANLERIPLAAVRQVVSERAAVPDTRPRSSSHGPRWLRLAGHLTYRASRRPHSDYLVDLFVSTARGALGDRGADVLDALVPELVAAGDEPIRDIVLRDPPASFARLIDTRSAA